MTFQQFAQMVEKKIKEELKDKADVKLHTVEKNNNTRKTGLLFCVGSAYAAPTIYLEEWYERYKEGEHIWDIVQSILVLYGKIKERKLRSYEDLQNYERIRNRVAYRLINRETNKGLLKEIPYVEYMDLAIVFYVLLETDDHEMTSMLIRNAHMTMWKTDTETLHKDAVENTPRLLPSEFKSMQEMLKEMAPWEGEDFMYVLTNEHRSYGAASVLYPHCLEKIAEKLKESYYVLPSSLHEVLIVRESAAPERASLRDMVEKINRTQVEEEEILSNAVYYYDRIEKKLA